jgi:hypothetical protein
LNFYSIVAAVLLLALSENIFRLGTMMMSCRTAGLHSTYPVGSDVSIFRLLAASEGLIILFMFFIIYFQSELEKTLPPGKDFSVLGSAAAEATADPL